MDSITGLFNQLLDAHLNKELLRPQLNPLINSTLAKHKRAVRASLYRTLFAHLNGPLQDPTLPEETWSDNRCGGVAGGMKEQLLQIVFDMRRQRKYDEAHRLERLVSSLPNVDGGRHPELKAAIQLLLVLARTSRSHEKLPVGHIEPNLPLVGPQNKEERAVFLPSGPRYHGDSCHVYSQGYQGYIHYSRNLFEGQKLETDRPSIEQGRHRNYSTLQNKLFEAEPGRDLLGNGLFTLKGLLDNEHEHRTRDTLFNGLTHSKTRRLDIKLDVPELPDTTNVDLLGLQIPCLSEPSEDEGFHESSSLSTPAVETPVMRDDNIWQKALDYQPNRHYTWETIGTIPRNTERPYLTEAGPRVFDEMYRLRCREASVLDASLERPVVIAPDQVQLVRDSIHVLLSVPSLTFRLDKKAQCFVVNPEVCLTGTSPASFSQLLADLAQAGTDHYRLTLFAQHRALDSSYTGGLVLQAFTSGVRRFLQYYQAVIQGIPSDGKLTVMRLKAMFGKMMQQLRYLADLCGCNHRLNTKPGDPGDSFPLGIQLLSYLYEEALDCSLQDRYQLVLSLLRSSCGPYLMFIQDWVFHGICRDVFGEFLIFVSDEYLHYRDKHYWTQGFVMKSDNAEENVPMFLKDLAYDIYVCGKSLNLMRLCCPEHFLCNPGVTIARISLTFSAEELDNSAKRTGVYISHMQALARQKTISRQEQELIESEARQALVSQVRQAASAELKRFQDAIQEQRNVENAKKRQEFQLLKDQMQRDLVRRALVDETERQEDIDRMDALTKREGGEANAENELEQKVREEMIDYYARLTEKASGRERKALWRVSRHQLAEARRAFIVKDEARIRQELADKQSAETAVDSLVSEVKDVSGTFEETKGAEVTLESGTSQNLASLGATGLSVDKSDGSRLFLSQQGAQLLDMPIETMIPQQAASEKTDREANQSEQAPRGLIKVGNNEVKTGGVPNKDIEAALQMISQGSGDSRPTAASPVRVAPPPNIMDLSIQDFLPRKQGEDDGLEMASSNDGDIDDVLIQIGSGLPTRAPNLQASWQNRPTSSAVDDMLGLPSSTDPAVTATFQAHPSDSDVGGTPVVGVEQSAPAYTSTRGRPADSRFRVGYESMGGEANCFVKSAFGHAGDSSLGDVLYPRDDRAKPGGTSTGLGDPLVHDKPNQERTTTCPSGSMISYPATFVEQPVPAATATHGRPFDSALQGVYLNQPGGEDNKVKMKSAFGHAGDSTLGDVLYPAAKQPTLVVTDKDLNSVLPVSQSGNTGSEVNQTETQVRVIFKPPLAHVSDSTIQSMLYPQDGQMTDINKQPGRTNIVALHHGHHPSDSTAQTVMYGKRGIGGTMVEEMRSQTVDHTDSGYATEDKAVSLWTGQGVEPLQDNFEALDKPPMPDLLSNTGYMPLSTEIGDYGLQAAESESIEAVELQSLPIIMKRSVTAPLLAQISLVNRSILDYFMVELGIGKHFRSLRSFLFLEDGEFGQSLCDQLFDKLSQGLRPNELLTPLILNPVLARAIQNSASRESVFAGNLGFSLKYLPHHFKPNAIGTFDCLELRYRVDWPCNIVITDTCLAKYNKVFSFLLQLKRISWVLRDIYFQLKRSAMVSHADNSPQFRQLQLFRHEMQHFVNVMQGYVVNQVIHVSWEEFQRQLKTEVYNLDDIHQKHAEYLNKAVFRCLLNKKAVPVMKIILDILCLILKVRTQLVAASWVYDKETKQASHPGFHTIKMSYLAFKDYSEFLYKVVAKLVTRGYQPHLEEFMLRLNFNDFYKDS